MMCPLLHRLLEQLGDLSVTRSSTASMYGESTVCTPLLGGELDQRLRHAQERARALARLSQRPRGRFHLVAQRAHRSSTVPQIDRLRCAATAMSATVPSACVSAW